MHILVPNNFRSGKGDFSRIIDDFSGDENQVRKVMNDFIRTLELSFREDARRLGKRLDEIKVTEPEKKRRVLIMAKWYNRLRGDFHFGATRAVETIGKALRSELDGVDFIPPVQQKLWAPN